MRSKLFVRYYTRLGFLFRFTALTRLRRIFGSRVHTKTSSLVFSFARPEKIYFLTLHPRPDEVCTTYLLCVYHFCDNIIRISRCCHTVCGGRFVVSEIWRDGFSVGDDVDGLRFAVGNAHNIICKKKKQIKTFGVYFHTHTTSWLLASYNIISYRYTRSSLFGIRLKTTSRYIFRLQ